MQKQIKFITYFILFSVFICLTFQNTAKAEDKFIITNVIPDESGKLFVVNGVNTEDVANYKVTKLENPERIVVDLPNAVLVGKKRYFDIASTGITGVRIAQFSVEPNIVRLVFVGDSQESVRKLSFNKSQNTLVFKLNGVETPKYEQSTVYQDKDINEVLNVQNITIIKKETVSDKQDNNTQQAINIISKDSEPQEHSIVALKKHNNQNIVINTIRNINNQLVFSGIGTIAIKEPFILQDPTRLVIDIPNSSLASPELIKAYKLNDKDTMRVGQFDSETLRLVVETTTPNSYKTIISPDLQSLVIAPDYGINLAFLPNSKEACQIQDIKIRKKDVKSTTITLTATQPIIHNIRHLYRPDKAFLELYNVNAPTKSLITSLPKTGQFHGVDINYIEKYPLGASWMFPLNYGSKIESKLSVDGKTLEVTFIDKLIAPRGKIVIDAGHGGNEPGANRAGIYEKHITLELAKKVYKYLSSAGVDVIMTRTEDESLSLKQRVAIANDTKPNAFVSIHVNACDNTKVNGVETHWYNTQSRGLASQIHYKMTNYLKANDRGIIKSMFYVIHHTDAPSVLVEIGFMSNEEERQLVLTEERQDTTARAIADGIIQYLRMGY